MTESALPLREGEAVLSEVSPPQPAVPLPEAPPVVDVEALYREHRTLLMSVACRKFRVPDADAENILQEIFIAFMQNSARIVDVRAWLVAAVCNACRHYRRVTDRLESLPEDYLEYSDPLSDALPERRAMEMTLQQALGYLQPRCQETLRLHYFDGRSAAEVAKEFETTTRYAEKLIHNCLKRVREIYMNITAVTR